MFWQNSDIVVRQTLCSIHAVADFVNEFDNIVVFQREIIFFLKIKCFRLILKYFFLWLMLI